MWQQFHSKLYLEGGAGQGLTVCGVTTRPVDHPFFVLSHQVTICLRGAVFMRWGMMLTEEKAYTCRSKYSSVLKGADTMS